MWTLLCATAQFNGFRPTPQAREQRNGAAEGEVERTGLRSEVRIYMHPGRTAVGEIDLARAGEQFDLKKAQLFASLDEAEPACAGRVGFLLEVCDAGHGTARRGAGGAVLFVEGLGT